jgi:hypothetical protein
VRVGATKLRRWRANGTTDVARWTVDGRPPSDDEVQELLATVPADLAAVLSYSGELASPAHTKLDDDLAELGELLFALTGVDGPLGDQLDAALDLGPGTLDGRVGELDFDSQDALAELVGSFPRVEDRVPRLRMLANELHGDDCPNFAGAMARHLERLLVLRAAKHPDEDALSQDALTWLEDRTLRF